MLPPAVDHLQYSGRSSSRTAGKIGWTAVQCPRSGHTHCVEVGSEGVSDCSGRRHRSPIITQSGNPQSVSDTVIV